MSADCQLLDVRDVAALLKVSVRQIWKLVASGRLPQPVRLGRSVRWLSADIGLFVLSGCNMEKYQAARQEMQNAKC